jgi:zinc transporter ZupT
MVQERSVLVEIMAIIPRSLLELSAPLVILIGILVVVAVIPQTLPTLNPFLEFR